MRYLVGPAHWPLAKNGEFKNVPREPYCVDLSSSAEAARWFVDNHSDDFDCPTYRRLVRVQDPGSWEHIYECKLQHIKTAIIGK